MVIAIINGGFANQLYRYACAYATAKKYNQELVIIGQTTEMGTDPFQLGEFNLEYWRLYMVDSYRQSLRLLEAWKGRYRLKEVCEAEYLAVIHPDLFEQYEGIILYGTYQNQVYFRDYIGDLRSILQFKEDTAFLKVFREEIKDKQSVAIHVRRGDFLTYDGLFGGGDFYKAAMCAMEDKIGYGKAEYYIFSDDKEWVRSFFGKNKRIHYVQVYGDYREAVEEFMALSMCAHRILTVASSFSRMADALNANPDGYVIYEQNGFLNMAFLRENLLYLDKTVIAALAGYYSPIFERDALQGIEFVESDIFNLDLPVLIELSIDARDITKENETAFRMRKIELLIQEGCYGEALGQAVKLWEMTVGTQFEQEMHKLYWTCLYKYGYRLESIIEAVFLKDIQAEAGQYYSLEEQELLRDLCSIQTKSEVILIPSRRFDPCVSETMIQTGKLLRRAGYEVIFMFWEPEQGSEYCVPYKKTLNENTYYEDVMGHKSRCPMVNLTRKEEEYGTLRAFFDSYFEKSEKTVLFAKQSKILLAAQESRFSSKIKTVYWDYSDSFDLGNYKGLAPHNYGINFLLQERTEESEECASKADYRITFDDVQGENPVLVLQNFAREECGATQKRQVADYYRFHPITVENTFLIIKNILKTGE